MINNAIANPAPGTHPGQHSEVKKVERLFIVGSISVIMLKENSTISQPVPAKKPPTTGKGIYRTSFSQLEFPQNVEE
ncbi:MAG: hypothetical protein CM1200mP10_12230 [Candidatus Neomarinimicrobiota bacterium]|nr:MAG: hypothetical protein CM1200mP10_12230 [Candidatus Neomarinimicrobiota bacterium]